jgi:MarR family transcriptional regulator, lower aerobic nicotinate degradation pathway regulator
MTEARAIRAIQTAGMPNCVPEELLSSPAFLLARLGMSVKAEVIDEFEKAGLSPYHYSVLALLDEGERETQATIGDVLGFDRTTLVGLLDALERDGLIHRRRDADDRRRHVVGLTPAGRRKLRSYRTLAARIEDEIFSPLSAADRAELHRILLGLAAHRDERFVRPPAFGDTPDRGSDRPPGNP